MIQKGFESRRRQIDLLLSKFALEQASERELWQPFDLLV
jgi:hypothetical protein